MVRPMMKNALGGRSIKPLRGYQPAAIPAASTEAISITCIPKNRPDPKLSGEVECDEVYIVAGHNGHPNAVKKKGVQAAGGA